MWTFVNIQLNQYSIAVTIGSVVAATNQTNSLSIEGAGGLAQVETSLVVVLVDRVLNYLCF